MLGPGWRGWHHHFRGKRGWLRPLILAMLSQRPMNGIEIMDAIYEYTGRAWRPSPGSVYPMLAELAEEGLIRRRDDGRYELTDEGRELARLVAAPLAPAPGDPLDALRGAVDELERLASEDPSYLRSRAAEIAALADRLRRLAGQG